MLPQARAPRRPALDGVNGRGVGDGLDERRRGTLRDDLEGTDPERKPGVAVNLAKLLRELDGQELLPAVVSSLDDDGLERPPGQGTVRARGPNPLHLVAPLLSQASRASLPRRRDLRRRRRPGLERRGVRRIRRPGPRGRQRGGCSRGVQGLQRRVDLVVDGLGHLLQSNFGGFALVRRDARRSPPSGSRVLHEEGHANVAPLGAAPAPVAVILAPRVGAVALVRRSVARKPRDAAPPTGRVPAARPRVVRGPCV